LIRNARAIAPIAIVQLRLNLGIPGLAHHNLAVFKMVDGS